MLILTLSTNFRLARKGKRSILLITFCAVECRKNVRKEKDEVAIIFSQKKNFLAAGKPQKVAPCRLVKVTFCLPAILSTALK
jgi:hypothetical protein